MSIGVAFFLLALLGGAFAAFRGARTLRERRLGTEADAQPEATPPQQQEQAADTATQQPAAAPPGHATGTTVPPPASGSLAYVAGLQTRRAVRSGNAAVRVALAVAGAIAIFALAAAALGDYVPWVHRALAWTGARINEALVHMGNEPLPSGDMVTAAIIAIGAFILVPLVLLPEIWVALVLWKIARSPGRLWLASVCLALWGAWYIGLMPIHLGPLGAKIERAWQSHSAKSGTHAARQPAKPRLPQGCDRYPAYGHKDCRFDDKVAWMRVPSSTPRPICIEPLPAQGNYILWYKDGAGHPHIWAAKPGGVTVSAYGFQAPKGQTGKVTVGPGCS